MSYNNGPKITTNGLIMCVDAANAKSYPGTGTAWTDISYTGMDVTNPNYSFSTNNKGCFYNSTQTNSGGMTFSLTSFSKLTGTIEFWANPSSWVDSNGLFINRSDTTANAADWLWFGVWSGGSVLYFRLGDGSACCNNDNTVSSWSSVHATGTWGHYVASWTSGGSSNIYFNGVLKAYRTISTIPSTNPSSTGQIGIGHTNTNSRWLGYIATAKIYNRQLTDSEILQNYNATKGRFGL